MLCNKSYTVIPNFCKIIHYRKPLHENSRTKKDIHMSYLLWADLWTLRTWRDSSVLSEMVSKAKRKSFAFLPEVSSIVWSNGEEENNLRKFCKDSTNLLISIYPIKVLPCCHIADQKSQVEAALNFWMETHCTCLSPHHQRVMTCYRSHSFNIVDI